MEEHHEGGSGLPLILLGEEREALTWGAEAYKAAVRRYMEATGFAQTIDSYVEGTVEDMVFAPAGPLVMSKVHVEAKDTELSLTDEEFRHEVAHHLKTWLRLHHAARFDFFVFARGLRNLPKWRAVFREPTVEGISDFLQLDSNGVEASLKELVEARWPEVLTFFTRTIVIRGTVEKLQRAAEKKEESSLGTPARWAEELSKRMDRRTSVGSEGDTLVANMAMVRFPKPLVIAEVTSDYFEELTDQLGIQGTPPCKMIARRKLLTFGTNEVLEALASVRAGRVQNVSLESVKMDDPGAIVSLIHQYVGKIAILKGARCEEGEFYFQPPIVDGLPQPFVVPGIKDNEVSLAEPKFKVNRKSRDPPAATELSVGAGRQKLNFVFHVGFRFRVEEVWGAHHVAFIPHRVYTKDGVHKLPSKVVTKIDKSFRDSQYNRAPAQLTKLQATVDYLFSRPAIWRGHAPRWYDVLQLDYPELGANPDKVARALLRVQTRWKPTPGVTGDPTLEDYVEERLDET